jgi:hypothetical protein
MNERASVLSRPLVGAVLVLLAAAGLTGCPARPGLTVRPDGLGLASFGQSYDEALPALTARLGAPTNPGVPGSGYGHCGVIGHRDVRWGHLTVSFTDTGSGLRVSGYYWGNDMGRRNSGTFHPAPAGPGAPVLANPWGLGIGTPVPSTAALVTTVQQTYPQATFQQLPGIVDPAVSTPLPGGRYLHVVLHATGTGAHVVESIWALTPREVVCP